jgi:pyrimidine oxygenase
VGSYGHIAEMFDEMSAIPGLGCVLLTFDDFVAGVEAFGSPIQPLMRCRSHIVAEAA